MARFCGSCGSDLRETAAFCGKCGVQAKKDQPLSSQGLEAPKPSHRNLILGILTAALIVAATGYWLFPFQQKELDNNQPHDLIVVASDIPKVAPIAENFDVRAYCAQNPNDAGPGEQDTENVPSEVRAVDANFWRCAGGRVLVCFGGASGRACMPQANIDSDYLAELDRYCQKTPDSFVPNSVAGPGREWRCIGVTAVSEDNPDVDSNGYLRSSWRNLDSLEPQKAEVSSNSSSPKFTGIPGPESSFSCWHAFDMNGSQIVGSWDHETPDDQFFGINGKKVKFRESAIGNRSVFTSAEGIEVISTTGREIRGESYYQYPASLWETKTTLKINGISKDYALFRFCSDN